MKSLSASISNFEKSSHYTPIFGLCITFFLMPIWGYHLYKYAGDSFFNFWFAQYYADNLQYLLFLPDTINVTNNVSLNPLPIFYAQTLHWPVALLTNIFPVRYSYWIYLFLCTYIQYIVCAFTFSTTMKSRSHGNIIAAIIVCSGYAMNNLYARGALAEYCATALATAGLCALLSIKICPNRQREWLFLAAGLFMVSFNMHPITSRPLKTFNLLKYIEKQVNVL